MNFLKRRQQLFDQMEENAALILFSGIETHVSADEYAPFEANRNFFYLTGLRRERMILLMKKTKRDPKEILFIEEADPTQERWYGRSMRQKRSVRSKMCVSWKALTGCSI